MFYKPTPVESCRPSHTHYVRFREFSGINQMSCIEMLEFSGFFFSNVFSFQVRFLESPSFIFSDVFYVVHVPGSVTQSLV